MRLSLSSFVRPFVCPYPSFPLVSLELVVHLKCHKATKSVIGIHLQSISVSRVFKGTFKEVLSAVKKVPKVFQGRWKGFLMQF